MAQFSLNWKIVSVEDDSVTIRWWGRGHQLDVSYSIPLDSDGNILTNQEMNRWIQVQGQDFVNDWMKKREKRDDARGWVDRTGTIQVNL